MDWNLVSGVKLLPTAGHTLRGCVDWNPIRITIKILINVTPFVGVWIETRMLSLARPDPESHTLRGCVDWNFISSHFDIKPWVTPFVGVWIETSRNQLIYVTYVVTPFVGVWIETTWKWQESCGMQRHTLRGCVDWNIFIRRYKSNFYFVTPFVGVWIETPLPVRQLADWNVTPFVGVWIETTSKMCHLKYTPSHTLRGCVDWNFLYIQLSTWRLESHPSWVCGLKLFYYINTLDIKSHTLRGCVDWNSEDQEIFGMRYRSHPSWVCGLKHSKANLCIVGTKSHPSWVCGLKLAFCIGFGVVSQSHPSWVCGLKLYYFCICHLHF